MATMNSMNISVPTPMREYIETKVDSGEYGSTSEAVRDAIREMMRRDAQLQLQTRIAEGLQSGSPIRVDEKYWAKLKQRAKKQRGLKKARHAAPR